jgi:ABC-type uncharacterized transport system permease subunit
MTTTDPSCRHAGTSWWNDRWAWRGALAAAPLGALLAILHALVVLRTGVEQALGAYVVGALVAAGIGCLLGGPLGAVGTGLRHRRCIARDEPAPTRDPELSAT